MKHFRTGTWPALQYLGRAGLWLICSATLLWSAEPESAEKPLASELVRLPPVAPEQALETFAIHEDFTLELVAAEPLLADPVDACFDEFGRMFIAEMHGYPYSAEKRQQCPDGIGKPDAGIVRMLEDTDGDGVMDRSVVFADKLSWPQSVCCYNGGIYCLAPPHLYYLKDTNDDDIADVREVVFSGFERSNVQGLANNLKWGPDLKIYGAGGTAGARLTHRGETLFSLGRRNFRFDPATEVLDAVAGGGQFGHCFDDAGNCYVCSNSNHIQHVTTRLEDLQQNPLLVAVTVLKSIAREGPAAPVYRRSPAEPWRIVRTRRRAADPNYQRRLPSTELVPTGFFTSATGITVFRGDAWPEQYQGNVFIGDVGGNLVHRKTMKPQGISFLAERADRDREFLASTDTWFRPVNFVNAPDGTLYLLDMYRETIEHPFSIPADIKNYLDLESGHDRGRVYRIRHRQTSPAEIIKPGEMTSADLVPLLSSRNAWQRTTAGRLLWERNARDLAPAIRRLVGRDSRDVAANSALVLLNVLQELDDNSLVAGFMHPSAVVRERAVQLAAGRLTDSPRIVEELLKLADDDSLRVRRQVAFAAGRAQPTAAANLLLACCRQPVSTDVQLAVRASVYPCAASIAERLLAKPAPQLAQGVREWLLPEVARSCLHQQHDAAVVRMIQSVLESAGPAEQQLVLQGVASGLKLLPARKDLLTWLGGLEGGTALQQDVLQMIDRAGRTAVDNKASVADRLAAIELLRYAPWSRVQSTFEELLAPAQPTEVQLQAIRAGQTQGFGLSPLFISRFESFTPRVREAAIDSLLAREATALELAQALRQQQIAVGAMTSVQRQQLLDHANRKAATLARPLLNGPGSASRTAVLKDYETALQITGDVQRGREVYLKQCANCHRAENAGFAVGPDLSSVSNKSAEDLLIAILDPNRERQPNYTAYNIATDDGQTHAGIVQTESVTAISLLQPRAVRVDVLRSQIEVMKSTDKSFMPEGMERDLQPREIADVIEFIRRLSRKPEGTSNP